ncbi:MAG: hypothetical protein ABI593_07810 [Betaproteobacteria bacterium]
MKFRTRGRFNVKRWSRALVDRVRGTPFDRALRAARRVGRREFVFGWNRGLGDIALGLVPLFARIRAELPGSRITLFTRADLAAPFQLTEVDVLHVVPALERGAPLDPAAAAASMAVPLPADAVVFADPDPTRWLDGRRREFAPRLRWNAEWNAKAEDLVPGFDGITIGAHVNSETARYYGYVKDWPETAWRQLFARFPDTRSVRWLLFGNAAPAQFTQPNIVDLRGRTDFLALLAVLRTRCRILVAPDSGVLTAAYYLDQAFPLEVISLWSDPRQGVLKQDCPSPNPELRHLALAGRDEDVRNLSVDEVGVAVAAALARCAHATGTEREPTIAS